MDHLNNGIFIGIKKLYVAWNYLLWNHHVYRARLHDERIERVISNWRHRIKE
jgi:hypothetical protein